MKHLNYHNVDLEFISQELRKGKIFIVPTDTCYGLITKVSEETVEKIHKIKNRPKTKFMPLFIRKNWVEDFIELNEGGRKIIAKFWPGALVLVGKVKLDKIKFFKSVLGPKDTIAVREPNYNLVLRILNHFGEPITATSANISGQQSCYTETEILKQFEGKKYQPDYILDLHSLPKRKSSTIIDIETLEIIREGEISKNVIADFLNS